MTRDKVVAAFCEISSQVATRKFKNRIPSDCFCHPVHNAAFFEYSEEVINFIADAVESKLKEEE